MLKPRYPRFLPVSLNVIKRRLSATCTKLSSAKGKRCTDLGSLRGLKIISRNRDFAVGKTCTPEGLQTAVRRGEDNRTFPGFAAQEFRATDQVPRQKTKTVQGIAQHIQRRGDYRNPARFLDNIDTPCPQWCAQTSFKRAGCVRGTSSATLFAEAETHAFWRAPSEMRGTSCKLQPFC